MYGAVREHASLYLYSGPPRPLVMNVPLSSFTVQPSVIGGDSETRYYATFNVASLVYSTVNNVAFVTHGLGVRLSFALKDERTALTGGNIRLIDGLAAKQSPSNESLLTSP